LGAVCQPRRVFSSEQNEEMHSMAVEEKVKQIIVEQLQVKGGK
jgi:hypothetical protein